MPIFSRLFRLFLAAVPQLSTRAMTLVLVWTAGAIVLSLLGVLADFLAWQWLPIGLLKGVFFGLSGVLLLGFILDYGSLVWLKFGFDVSKKLHIERQLPSNLSVFRPIDVRFVVQCGDMPKWARLCLMDFYPKHSQVNFLPMCLDAKQLMVVADEQAGSELTYELIPTRRGYAKFGGVDIQLNSRLGLVSLMTHVPSERIKGVEQSRVLADFKEAFSGNLHALAQKSAIGGLMHRKQRGQGQDFHQIRSYIEGDSIRHVDWRATARQGKLMTREFQDEQDQQIMFLLDASQNMRHARTHHHDDIYQSSHLDMALGAMLLLANIANEQGDATGFISFSGVNDKIVPPKKGAGVLSYLLNQSFDVQSSVLMPDYIAVAKSLLSIQKKRSLVILITNHKSQEVSELIDAIHLLRGKHMVVVASLYEEDLVNCLTSTPQDMPSALTWHSVFDHISRQEVLGARLKEMSHVQTLSCTPSQLPSLLVQTYLTLKRQHSI